MGKRLASVTMSLVLAVTVLALGQMSAAQRSVTRLSPTTAALLFDLYDRGDYAAFERELDAFVGAVTNWVEFEEGAQTWVHQSPARERRRLIAASVGLELAYAERDAFDVTNMLIEVGCELLRQQAPTPAERSWQLAAMALAQSMASDALILAPQNETPEMTGKRVAEARRKRQRATAGRLEPMADVGHLQHALARFPEEPALRMAVALTVERATRASELNFLIRNDPGGHRPEWMDAETALSRLRAGRRVLQGVPWNVRVDAPVAAALLELEPELVAAKTSRSLWRLADQFGALAGDAGSAQEAHVRQGVTYTRLARPDLALAAFRRAEQAGDGPSDPYYTYLARFLAGRVLRDGGHRAEAQLALRGALAIVPRAQSAAFALAPLLFAAGDRAEAVALNQAAFQHPLATDPWKSYLGGDPARWARHLAALRQALQ